MSDNVEQNMSEFRLLKEGGVDSRLALFLDKLQLKARNIHTHLVASATSASLRLLTFLSPKRQALIMFDEKQTSISTPVNSAALHSGRPVSAICAITTPPRRLLAHSAVWAGRARSLVCLMDLIVLFKIMRR